MTYISPTKKEAVAIAKQFKKRLQKNDIPVVEVLLFGSYAKGTTHKWSDIDVAVVYKPFGNSRSAEKKLIRRSRERYDIPMDIVCFQKDDMKNKFLGVAQEVKRTGIAV